MKPVNSHASSRSSPKACTDCTTPDRVMNVPKIVRKNVTMTSDTFHTFSMPAPFLHHHRVQQRRRGEPRQQAGVLDRVPAPVAAPARVPRRPTARPSARPTVRNSHAIIVQRRIARSHESSSWPGRKRRHAERERNRHPDEAQIQHRRVDGHVEVLQQRAEAGAVGRRLRQDRCRTGCCATTIRNRKNISTAEMVATTHGISRRCRSRLT